MSKAKPLYVKDVEVENFIKRRDEMLEKRSVDALIEFVKTDKVYDDDPVREELLKQPRDMQELTLCKAILMSTRVSADTKAWAHVRYGEIRDKIRDEIGESKNAE